MMVILIMILLLVDRFDDNSLQDITVDDSTQLLTAVTRIGNSPYDYSDVNNVTPPANSAVVTVTNNINNESGISLMDSTFPRDNDNVICFPTKSTQLLTALTLYLDGNSP